MIKASEALARVEEIRATKESEKAEAVKAFCEETMVKVIKSAIEANKTETHTDIPHAISATDVAEYLRANGYRADIEWGYKNAYVYVSWDKPTA